MPRIAKAHEPSRGVPEFLHLRQPIRKRWTGRRAFWIGAIAVAVLAAGGWTVTAIWVKASFIRAELETSIGLAAGLQTDLSNDRMEAANDKVDQLRAHTAAARKESMHPLWRLASLAPGIGQNFSAVAEIAGTADDVVNLGVAPLVQILDNLNWKDVVPTHAGANLRHIQEASPTLASAAHAVRLSSEKLENIDDSNLLEQVSGPLRQARSGLRSVTYSLDSAADASALAPQLLGSGTTRRYLLMIQNSAEVRASGGIPGALAVLTLQNGEPTLDHQMSATELGEMSPTLSVDDQQVQIYTSRLGKYMQDVNLTPDFPTAAHTARAIWEKKTGQQVDGVISIDPVALGYILDASGPVIISDPELVDPAKLGLPSVLSGANVVHTLLSEVYSKIENPSLQDAYFAGVAKKIFATLTGGSVNTDALVQGIRKGAEQGRILVWSSSPNEEAVISKYSLSGAVTGPSVSPAQFGVYFNDGTGAKMDYYVKRTVQLIKECPADGYEQTKVRIISTNTAPADAATSLPSYVTGGGSFGVAPGTVQTNIVSYGPVQANVESAFIDGQKIPFAPYLHANRPVGVVGQQLAPGESKTVEFTFGKIVQHTEPNIVVTPTVQHVEDVVLPTENASCDQGQ